MKVSALLQSLLIREVSECRKMVFFLKAATQETESRTTARKLIVFEN